MAKPGPTSLLSAGGRGTLFLDLGGPVLAAYLPGPDLASQLFTPLDMMDSPPFDEVLLVGLIAMVGNVLSHNIKEKYVTVRSAECAPVDRKGVPQDCR